MFETAEKIPTGCDSLRPKFDYTMRTITPFKEAAYAPYPSNVDAFA